MFEQRSPPDDSPSGVIVLDGHGFIIGVSKVVGTLLGASGEPLIGRDLFRDVAPALRVPAFMGRFLDGVRRGGLAENFSFLLGGERGATYLSVSMSGGGEPDRFQVTLSVLCFVEPGRHREAMLAVGHRARAEPIDPLVCEQEAIHIPGTIQSQGALLAVDPDSLAVTVASENVADVLGSSAADMLGHPLADVMPRGIVERIVAEAASLSEGDPIVRFTADGDRPARPFSVVLHRRAGRLLVELELEPFRPADFDVPSHSTIRTTMRVFRDAPDLGALVRVAADRLRAITGYERVLVYRFDDDWNGEAVAEAIAPDWEASLLGLRFPASDIPRQARDLYRLAPTRFVVDRDATPVPVRALADDNGPVDLSASVFRSLSPIHMEYQRNLGVNGSMSAAITMDGRLWGLVIGHHRRPHYLAPETREAVAIVTDALALRIHDLETDSLVARRNLHLNVEQRLLEELAASDDFVTALTDGPDRLTDLFGATGAAVLIAGDVVTIGEAPGHDDVRALADLLRNEAGSHLPYLATDHLSGLVPAAAHYLEQVSGVLATPIDAERRNILLWFRPEVAGTIVWSGDPNKPVMADTVLAAVLPRRSFERWVEERRGFSLPWAPWEIEIGLSLARAVGGVALRQSRKVRDLSQKQAELLDALEQKDQLIAQKDLLTREIDHRVKNSLQIVSAFVTMQSRHIKDPTAQQAFQETYGRVMSIARVHDSLYQSDDLQQVDLGQTIENLCRDLAGMEGQTRELELRAEKGLMVPYRKAVALCLIATELVTNAWKYAYPDKPTGFVEVVVERIDETGVCLSVRDQGEGLPSDWETRPRRGLGMQLIRAMLKQIEATMQVQSEGGARFTVTC